MPRSKAALRTTDGVMNTEIFTPEGSGPWPGAILYVDAFGVRPATESMAERLASAGYYVLLPDIFYRSQPIAPFDPAEVFKGGPERERLMAMIHATTGEKVMRDTAVCLDFMDTEFRVGLGGIGVTGYCMGGRLAMTAAGTFPERVAAAGIFHAGGLATDQPSSPHLLAPKIRARLYIAIAAIDQNFTDAERERLKQALDAAGVQYTMEVYPDVAHGFCVPGLPVFNEDGSERHWRELLKLFGEALPAEVSTTA